MNKINLSRREFLKLTTRALVGAAAASVSGYTYISGFEPGWIDIVPITLTLPRLPKDFHEYTIVQISDIHMDKWMIQDRLANIVDLVNGLTPDTIAVTGDFVTHDPEAKFDLMVPELSRLKPKDATVAVLGNHDHWTDPKAVRKIINHSGIINVSNTVHTLTRGATKLHFAGVDDYWEKQDRLNKVLRKLRPNDCAVLLAHEPDYADISAPTRQFDLQISGHSHGGQVIVPLVGPIVLPKFAEKYPLGLYKISDMFLYTNRGVGMVKPRVRFNCRPEISVFTLHAPI